MTDPTELCSSSGEPSSPLRRGVAAVFVRDAELLVIRRSAHVEAPGAWCFPGGGVERGESEEGAIRREMREELGAEVFPRRRLWRCVTDWQVALSWWLTEFQPPSELRINRREVEAALWLPIDQILSLPNLLSSNQEFLHAVQRGEIVLEGC